MGFLKRLRIADGTPVTGGPRPARTHPAPRHPAPRHPGPVKIVNGRKLQLHPTRGWKVIGRAD